MGINGISTDYYPTAYANNKTTKAETGGHFGVSGFWISNDGKECHITKMFGDRFVRWFNGEINPDDMLGNSVDSAKSAVEK